MIGHIWIRSLPRPILQLHECFQQGIRVTRNNLTVSLLSLFLVLSTIHDFSVTGPV